MLISLLATVMLATNSAADNPDLVLIEGSSTVGPFARAATSLLPSDELIEVRQDGTSAGIYHLCLNQDGAPEIAAASRRIKDKEIALCQQAGLLHLVEKPIGRDGIVMAQSKGAKNMKLTAKEVYLALSHLHPRSDNDCVLVENDKTNWRDVAPHLPNRQIQVIGPPRTSGTRDIFVEKALIAGARSFPCLASIEQTNEEYFARATRIRQDRHWIEGGEHDDAIASTLHYVRDAIGIFGYAYLLNDELIEPINFEGIEATPETIGSGDYPLSRPLYLYTTPTQLSSDETVNEIFKVFDSFAAIGPRGILTRMGLVVDENNPGMTLITTNDGKRQVYRPRDATSAE